MTCTRRFWRSVTRQTLISWHRAQIALARNADGATRARFLAYAADTRRAVSRGLYQKDATS